MAKHIMLRMAALAILTLPLIAAETGSCIDKSEHCKTWASESYNYCKTGVFKSYMETNCKKSCNLCALEVQENVCLDNKKYNGRCKLWKEQHCVQTSEWYSFMQDNCKKTCGFCSESCDDKANEKKYCALWKDFGYCKDSHTYYTYMKTNCRKTCGFCDNDKNEISCGKRGLSSERVIDGVAASPHTWPWSVALLRFDDYFCGGSLINDQWAVTAAHCLYNRESQSEYMDAVLGEHDRSYKDGNERKFGIEKIVNHPDYNGRSLDNDISLIKLKEKVKFNTTKFGTPDKVGTVCLPHLGDEVLKKNQECFITGWGKTKHPGPSSNILMEAKMPPVSSEECRKQNDNFISDKMFCAGNAPGTKQSGCHGDSGGPFVCSVDNGKTWTLIGVVSWGSKTCDRADKYTVFARVSKFVDWISTTVKNN